MRRGVTLASEALQGALCGVRWRRAVRGVVAARHALPEEPFDVKVLLEGCSHHVDPRACRIGLAGREPSIAEAADGAAAFAEEVDSLLG